MSSLLWILGGTVFLGACAYVCYKWLYSKKENNQQNDNRAPQKETKMTEKEIENEKQIEQPEMINKENEQPVNISEKEIEEEYIIECYKHKTTTFYNNNKLNLTDELEKFCKSDKDILNKMKFYITIKDKDGIKIKMFFEDDWLEFLANTCKTLEDLQNKLKESPVLIHKNGDIYIKYNASEEEKKKKCCCEYEFYSGLDWLCFKSNNFYLSSFSIAFKGEKNVFFHSMKEFAIKELEKRKQKQNSNNENPEINLNNGNNINIY